jgi:hypothetical protein
METSTRERLGEDVHELLAGANVLDADLARVDATTNVVIGHFNVLDPIMVHGGRSTPLDTKIAPLYLVLL